MFVKIDMRGEHMEPTLKNELNKLKQIKGKGFGLSKDDYENLILFFENCYGGKAVEIEQLL